MGLPTELKALEGRNPGVWSITSPHGELCRELQEAEAEKESKKARQKTLGNVSQAGRKKCLQFWITAEHSPVQLASSDQSLQSLSPSHIQDRRMHIPELQLNSSFLHW